MPEAGESNRDCLLGRDLCLNTILQWQKKQITWLKEASIKFAEGTKARAIADDCIRNTVFLATVLVLMAISQRFEVKCIRTGLIILSFWAAFIWHNDSVYSSSLLT